MSSVAIINAPPTHTLYRESSIYPEKPGSFQRVNSGLGSISEILELTPRIFTAEFLKPFLLETPLCRRNFYTASGI